MSLCQFDSLQRRAKLPQNKSWPNLNRLENFRKKTNILGSWWVWSGFKIASSSVLFIHNSLSNSKRTRWLSCYKVTIAIWVRALNCFVFVSFVCFCCFQTWYLWTYSIPLSPSLFLFHSFHKYFQFLKIKTMNNWKRTRLFIRYHDSVRDCWTYILKNAVGDGFLWY